MTRSPRMTRRQSAGSGVRPCSQAPSSSCVIWAHAGNNARFFYETMGGRTVAERTAPMMGDLVPEVAFGWKKLALAERSHAK